MLFRPRTWRGRTRIRPHRAYLNRSFILMMIISHHQAHNRQRTSPSRPSSQQLIFFRPVDALIKFHRDYFCLYTGHSRRRKPLCWLRHFFAIKSGCNPFPRFSYKLWCVDTRARFTIRPSVTVLACVLTSLHLYSKSQPVPHSGLTGLCGIPASQWYGSTPRITFTSPA